MLAENIDRGLLSARSSKSFRMFRASLVLGTKWRSNGIVKSETQHLCIVFFDRPAYNFGTFLSP